MIKKFARDLKTEFKGYGIKTLSQDAMAGLTVAAVALPLALAFGVSSGADAASGLITAIFAGLIIGVLSGASYQISGPTGAMSAILITVSVKYGIEGVLLAGFMSGALLVIAALFKVGNLVSYIPAPVITGFTSGIAIIIALGQIDNFFGTVSEGGNCIEKIISYTRLGFGINPWAVIFGGIVVIIMIITPKAVTRFVPSSLLGLIVAVAVNFFVNPDAAASNVTEVGTIPQQLMTGVAFWNGLSVERVTDLLMPALSIAALGMIESLLCGASAGKMKGEKIDAKRELMAQGIGNMIIPLLGGVPATAAIARTSVAIKSGGKTRLVSVFHSVTLILSMFLLGGVMSRIPLSALAGVLMVTAFRMNEWTSIKSIFNKKFKSSIVQYLATMVATVVFDLTVAIVIGVIIAMLAFIVKSCQLNVVVSDADEKKLSDKGVKGDQTRTRLVYLTGPLFFGTQEKLTETLHNLDGDVNAVIFSMRGVPTIDDGAADELETIYKEYTENGVKILFCGVQPAVMRVMERAGLIEKIGADSFLWDAVAAMNSLQNENVQAAG